MRITLLFAAAIALALPAAAQAQNCDRACLIDMANDYAAALVAHDPSDVPLARTIVTVEMRYAPPGGKIASGLLKMFRKEPGQQVGDDLRRFKQVLELGEVLFSDASSGTTPRPARPQPRATVH